MKNSAFPGLKPINKQQGFSLNQLSQWNQKLDSEKLKTLNDQQDIKKQKKIAKQSSAFLNTSIQQIQDQAVQISRQIEQQKTKYEQLNILVKNAEKQIYSQKLEKYEDVKNNKQTDEFQQQKKILSDRQKNLEKILDKLNSSDFQISKKIDAIRSLKKERGIHSNLFDKLEREYFDVQFYYKQLLIERTLKEKIMQKQVTQFNKVCQRSNDSNLKNESQDLQKQRLFQSQLAKSQQNQKSKALQLDFSRQKQVILAEALKTKKEIHQSKRNTQESKKIEYKKKLNHILNDFQCKSYEQFIKKDIHEIYQKQQEILSEVNQRYEDIYKIKDQIKLLENKIKEKKNNCQPKRSKIKSNVLLAVSNVQSELAEQKKQISSFKDQFYSLIDKISKQQNNDSKSQAQRILQKTQTNQNNLNFSENIQALKQLMAFFDDKVLQTHFYNTITLKQSKIKSSARKSSQKSKDRKLSSVKIEGKIKKVQTQTQQNFPSRRDSQYLDEIFNKYKNECQKPGKQEKIDTVTLLTQKQFVVESNRLISEVTKNKSRFAKQAQPTKK